MDAPHYSYWRIEASYYRTSLYSQKPNYLVQESQLEYC